MDSLAATIDTTLEEEELIADQLKEWLFGASALQSVVKRREALQVAKDEAYDNLNAAYEQKEKVMQGVHFYFIEQNFRSHNCLYVYQLINS